MKATAKQIFDYIQSLNPESSEISSVGSYVSQSAQMMADALYRECVSNLASDSIAYKIMQSTAFGRYSTKQLWVIAYALEQNDSFANMVGDHYAELNRKSSLKKEAIKEKQAAISAERKATGMSKKAYRAEYDRLNALYKAGDYSVKAEMKRIQKFAF